MEIQNKKRSKSAKPTSISNLFDEDFASGFEDSKFEKFKPAFKVLAIIIVLMGAVWGVSAYFGTTDTKNDTNKNYATDTVQQDIDEDSKLSQCITDANSKNPTPDTSDANFYPKLISGYDAQLACYDQYPDASGAVSRSSVEYARDTALDSSGNYKDTYISSGGGSSSTTSKNSVTGCDYSLSESEYLACSDRYYAAHSSPSNTASNNTGSSSNSSYTPPASSTSPSTNGGSSSSNNSSSSNAADRSYWQNKCEEQVRQQYGGTGLVESQRQQAVQQCMSGHGY